MNDPVTMRRKLRVELKRLRTARDLTQRHVAERLDWSQSKVIRIENGSVAVGVTDLEALLRLYGVDDQDTIASMIEMARGSKKLPFTDYKEDLPAETLRFFAYESSASIIRQVQPLLIPAVLQTEEYARALLGSAWGFEASRIDRLWAARLERQELLERTDPPEMFFIMDEAAVHRPVGGEGVMRHQRARLLELAARPRITIQVVPFEVGAHAGMRGPFVYLEFPGADDPDVLYLEGQRGDYVFRDEEDVTGEYLETFFKLEKIASSPNDLEKVLSGLPH
jgi:transcriptional regulator with XRE-family HTH domain